MPSRNPGVAAWGLAFAWLAGYEWWALKTHHQSLSRAAWQETTAWPPLTFLAGMVVGGLAVHLWWRWNPDTTDAGA